jgi:hypothetical protein
VDTARAGGSTNPGGATGDLANHSYVQTQSSIGTITGDPW